MSDTAPTFDFLILADRAEVLNGKLYMMGGGWEAIGVRAITDAVAFNVAVGISVPWLATNVDHAFVLRVEDADARPIVGVPPVGFKTGRPPTLEHGAAQRVIFTLAISLVVPRPGLYVVVAAIGDEEKRVPFQVRLAAHMPVPPHPGA